MKTIKLISIKYKDININQRDSSKIRGYFGNKYQHLEGMHNHKEHSYIYKYPHIQYKVIDNMPTIIGIEDGVNILHENVLEEDTIKLGEDNYIQIEEIESIYSKQLFGICNEFIEYEFDSPWLALNQKNIKEYKNSNYEEKMVLLTKILIGNILSCSKSIDYTVDEELQVGLDIYETSVNFKNKKMIGFKGRFCVNLKMPDYIGLGKSCSRGFGVIKAIK